MYMQIPAPQWIQASPRGPVFVQPAGAAAFANPINPLEATQGLSGGRCWSGMAGHAGDSSGLLRLAPASTTNVDPAWQRDLYLDPTMGPEAGPLMLQDAGLYEGMEMSAPSRFVIAPKSGPSTSLMPSAPVRNMASTTTAATATSSTRLRSPLSEPPLDPDGPKKKPVPNTTSAPVDPFDGGQPDLYNPQVVDGESAVREMLERQAKERQAQLMRAHAEAEAQRLAQQGALSAQSAQQGPSLLMIALGVGAVAGVAWWMSQPSTAKSA
jgi:hypothetical protein